MIDALQFGAIFVLLGIVIFLDWRVARLIDRLDDVLVRLTAIDDGDTSHSTSFDSIKHRISRLEDSTDISANRIDAILPRLQAMDTKLGKLADADAELYKLVKPKRAAKRQGKK